MRIDIEPLDPEQEPLGKELIQEYVAATAVEMETSVAALLPIIPDYHHFRERYQDGRFLVARVDEQIAGCVGITRATPERCEMNRLWVRPAFRRYGLGRRLAQASLEHAVRLGYHRMSLDVLTQRQRAIDLYRSLGFLEHEGYHHYDFPVVSMERAL